MTVKLYHGDCLQVLGRLEAESVHCVVTSPPYWGLRDYGTATWEGGDPRCDHDQRRREHDPDSKSSTNAGAARDGLAGKTLCRKCGARRVDAQLGLEATPEEHVERMVEVFRAVRRVMRKDATLWCNYGDVYYSDPSGFAGTDGSPFGNGGHASRGAKAFGRQKRPRHPTLKPKDLVGMPWRVAFALQADGWWLRSDIIWAKPNPMPESVTDRPTKSHEHLFLLAKSSTYFYDADAVREPSVTAALVEWPGFTLRLPTQGATAGRNLRDVWAIPAEPFPGAHFATFPPKLVEPCIKAGTSEHGCCATCGAPYHREPREKPGLGTWTKDRAQSASTSPERSRHWRQTHKHQPTDRDEWSPGCACAAPVVPCTVLDPFGGAGTVGLVADRLGRNAVLIELNPEYLELARSRIANDAPLFAQVEVIR